MPGGGRLTIELATRSLITQYARAHAEVTPGDYVMVAVSDTGHGMTPDIVARVFEPFFNHQDRRPRHRPWPRDGVRLRQAVPAVT